MYTWHECLVARPGTQNSFLAISQKNQSAELSMHFPFNAVSSTLDFASVGCTRTRTCMYVLSLKITSLTVQRKQTPRINNFSPDYSKLAKIRNYFLNGLPNVLKIKFNC